LNFLKVRSSLKTIYSMSKIKILFGLEASAGGALKHVSYLVTRLNKEYFDPTVVLSKSRGNDLSIEIQKIQESGVRVLVMNLHRRISILKDMIAIIKIFSLIKKNRYEIVHAHSSKAGGIFRLAAYLNSVPIIFYTPHGLYYQGKAGLLRAIYICIERLLSFITTFVIVSDVEIYAITKYRIFPESKIISINNAIDCNEYKRSSHRTKIKAKLGIKGNPSIIGTVGRLVHQKDLKTYIFAAREVLKSHSNIVFLIVGEGYMEKKLRALIHSLDLEDNIILTGYISDIHEVYSIVDIYINSSLWEGLPYVILEAMWYEKPIIATQTGTESVVIHEVNGYLCPVRDYAGIASRISVLLRDNNLASMLGKNSKRILKDKYSIHRFVEDHEALYHSCFSRAVATQITGENLLRGIQNSNVCGP
jgi:glycosyltransferase involved in cell wall biosynthesis